jgi:DUF4097 and DUF4098 domain-containing protein YvlB
MTFRKKSKFLLASVIILLLLLIMDISINKEAMLEAFGEQFANEQRTDEFREAHQALEKTVQRQLEMERTNIKELSLSNTRGNITVKRAEGNTVILQYTVTVTDTDEADRKLEAVKVEKEVRNGHLTFVPYTGSQPIKSSSMSIDYLLFVPDDMKISIENERGYIYINGTKGDVDAKSVHGFMEIVHVEGNLSVKSSHHHIYLSDIKGNIELENRFSDADIENIDGAIVLDSQHGDNSIFQTEGGITAAAEFGSVHLRAIGGPVEVKSRLSDIQLSYIRNHIKVTSVQGKTRLVLPESEGYTLDAKVSAGSIRTHLPFHIEKGINGAHETHVSGVVGVGTWTVDLDVSSSQLTIH